MRLGRLFMIGLLLLLGLRGGRGRGRWRGGGLCIDTHYYAVSRMRRLSRDVVLNYHKDFLVSTACLSLAFSNSFQ